MADETPLDSGAEAALSATDVLPAIVPRRRPEDTEMDITPMIDCTFLLLIFFLLTSMPEEGAYVPLPPAKYGVPVPSKNAVVLTVNQGEPDALADVYKGNIVAPENLVESSDLEAMEEEITRYVEGEIRGGSRRAQCILIRAAEGVKHRDVARVARAASRAADAPQLHVAVLEVE